MIITKKTKLLLKNKKNELDSFLNFHACANDCAITFRWKVIKKNISSYVDGVVLFCTSSAFAFHLLENSSIKTANSFFICIWEEKIGVESFLLLRMILNGMQRQQ